MLHSENLDMQDWQDSVARGWGWQKFVWGEVTWVIMKNGYDSLIANHNKPDN